MVFFIEIIIDFMKKNDGPLFFAISQSIIDNINKKKIKMPILDDQIPTTLIAPPKK